MAKSTAVSESVVTTGLLEALPVSESSMATIRRMLSSSGFSWRSETRAESRRAAKT